MASEILTSFVFPPPPSTFVKVMMVVVSTALPLIGFSETRGKHLQYSKFWDAKPIYSTATLKLSSRLGMLVIYTPAFLAGVFALWYFPNDGYRFLLLKSAVTIHFLKRILEVLFLHKYSSKMVLTTAIAISLSYFSGAVMMIYSQSLIEGVPDPEQPIDMKNIGIVLFFIGIIGNFYHHFLLSKTRKKGETGYKIPKGGLFCLVICPHYMFEIITFFGFALISQTMFSICFTFGTALYLGGRSYATRQWYISKFDDFPKNVKALVPFVF